MQEQAAQQNPLDQVKTDDASIVDLVNRIKAQILALDEGSPIGLHLYEAMLTIIKLHSMLAESLSDMQSIYDLFNVGENSREMWILLPNIENLIRRAACLSEIEQRFFTATEKTDEGDMEVCLLNWGDEPDQYAMRFALALENRKEQSPIILLN